MCSAHLFVERMVKLYTIKHTWALVYRLNYIHSKLFQCSLCLKQKDESYRNNSCYIRKYTQLKNMLSKNIILACLIDYKNTTGECWMLDFTGSLHMHPLKHWGSEIGSERYDWRRFSRRPVGGSLVIFTPFCRIVTGN